MRGGRIVMAARRAEVRAVAASHGVQVYAVRARRQAIQRAGEVNPGGAWRKIQRADYRALCIVQRGMAGGHRASGLHLRLAGGNGDSENRGKHRTRMHTSSPLKWTTGEYRRKTKRPDDRRGVCHRIVIPP